MSPLTLTHVTYFSLAEASLTQPAELREPEGRHQDTNTYLSVDSESYSVSTYNPSTVPSSGQYLPAATNNQQVQSAAALYAPQTVEAAVNPAPPYEQLQLNSSDTHAYQHITTTSELPNVSVQSSATDSQYNSNGLSNNPSSGQVIDSVEC